MRNDERIALFKTRDVTLGNKKDIKYIRKELDRQAKTDEKLGDKISLLEKAVVVNTAGLGIIYAGAFLFIKTIFNKLTGWL